VTVVVVTHHHLGGSLSHDVNVTALSIFLFEELVEINP
jgi:hypothetical protein